MYVSPVLLAVDGHTPHSHLGAGPEHPDGDLPPVGHQNLLDGSHIAIADQALAGEVGDGGMCRWSRPKSQVS